jgi:hypothetical protein
VTRLVLLPALGGCLFLAAAPPGADPSPECADTGCGGYTCDTFLDACSSSCDGGTPCAAGYLCDAGSCVPLCDERDCDDHLGCDELRNECRTDCEVNEDCAGGYTCCTSAKASNDRCDDVGTCF